MQVLEKNGGNAATKDGLPFPGSGSADLQFELASVAGECRSPSCRGSHSVDLNLLSDSAAPCRAN